MAPAAEAEALTPPRPEAYPRAPVPARRRPLPRLKKPLKRTPNHGQHPQEPVPALAVPQLALAERPAVGALLAATATPQEPLHDHPLPLAAKRKLAAHRPLLKHLLRRPPHLQRRGQPLERRADESPVHDAAGLVTAPDAVAPTAQAAPHALRLQVVELQRPQPLVLQPPKLQRHLLGPKHPRPLADALPKVLKAAKRMPVARLQRLAKRHMLKVLLHPVQVRQRHLPRPQHLRLLPPHQLDARQNAKKELGKRFGQQRTLQQRLLELPLQRRLLPQPPDHLQRVRRPRLPQWLKHCTALVPRRFKSFSHPSPTRPYP